VDCARACLWCFPAARPRRPVMSSSRRVEGLPARRCLQSRCGSPRRGPGALAREAMTITALWTEVWT